jgi:exopolysaccharide production protein ExoZ
MPEKRSSKLLAVQALRAFAALMVVFGHTLGTVHRESQGISPTINLSWGAGVDLFFVISGFIMVYSSERLFRQPKASLIFLLRRLARIVPLYWATTTFFIISVFAFSNNTAFLSLPAILTSYLFIPYNTHGSTDGFVFPIFDLGWTLNYEMLFYVIFALFIWLDRWRASAMVVVFIGALVVFGLLVRPESAALRFWTQPISLEFILGLFIGLAKRSTITIPTSLRLIFFFAGLLFIFADPFGLRSILGTTPNDFTRVIAWGVPSALMLAAASLSNDAAADERLGWASGIGDASYSLYLTHPFILLAFNKIARAVPIQSAAMGVTAVVLIVTMAVLLSLVSFRVFESRMSKALQPGL